MLLLLFVGRLQSSTALRLDFHIIRIIAIVIRDRPARKLKNARGHAVEEITVMRDNQHAAGIVLKEALKPFNHMDIEMVCRFIEEQKVRLA